VRGRNKSLAVDPLRSSIAVVRLQNLAQALRRTNTGPSMSSKP
jgi:hypothetical protein